VSAREEERRRLRRDLHDELAPTLSALALMAATARDRAASDMGTLTLLDELYVVCGARWATFVGWSTSCGRRRWMSWGCCGGDPRTSGGIQRLSSDGRPGIAGYC
jgi:hypothetical protein